MCCCLYTWLRGYSINHRPIFPAAGYVAMVIQAMHERCMEKEDYDPIYQYKLRNLHFSKAFWLPESKDGVEVILSLRPFPISLRTSSTDQDEFRVFSYTEGGWTEHCRGLISVD